MILVHLVACVREPPTSHSGTGPPDSETGASTVDSDSGGTGTPNDGVLDVHVVDGYAWPTTDLQAGQTIHVWAAVDPQTEIVSGWTGDVGGLASPAEWNSEYMLPNHDVTLTPTITSAPWTPEVRTYDLEGRTRDAWVIAAPDSRGIAFFFHGAAYSLDQLRSNAGSTIAMALVRAGWTVVGVESEAEAAAGTGGWSSTLNLATNTDLRNVQALKNALVADGTAEETEPWIAVGKSSGGMFANAVGAMGLADVVVSYCAPGDAAANVMTSAPTAWYLAEVDTTFPTAPEQADGFATVLQGRGLRTDLYVHPTTPLYDQRFARIAGIDAATSKDLAARLRADGAVDENGQWTNSGAAIYAGLTLPDGLTNDQKAAIDAEIEIMAADHELYDDVAARMVAFLEDAT